MSPFEYTIIAILAAISSFIFVLSKGWQKGSVFAFLILYGINFFVILFIFWVGKLILG